MSTYNPRIVAQALEDLESEITRWSSVASDMLTTALDTQQHADEVLDRTLHYAAIVLDRAKDDEERVEKTLASVAITIEKCAAATETAQNTLEESQAMLMASNTLLQKWQTELEKAVAWFTRAKARSERALHELDSVRSTLKSAILDLSNAEARLRACKNEKRRDCKSEVTAVGKARAEVTHAQKMARATEQEVNAANEEVERAKARGACCKRAVAFSTEAVNLSQESVHTAIQAANIAERSFEFALAADRFMSIAQEKMLAQVGSAENMMAETKKAQEFNHEAKIHLKSADKAENRAQTYATSVRKELGYRIQQLLDLNRLDTLQSGAGSSPKNVSPSEIKVTRFDDKTQIINGGKRKGVGQTIGPHGHPGIDQSGEIDYAGPQKGAAKKDTGQ